MDAAVQQYRTRFVRDTGQQDIPGRIKERRVQDACYWIRGTVQDTGLKCPWDTEYRMIRTGFIFKRRIESTPGNSYVIVISLHFVSILSLFPGYHAEGYHAPSLPPRAITPVYTSRLSHQSYHAPPHTYIGLSHLLFVIRFL